LYGLNKPLGDKPYQCLVLAILRILCILPCACLDFWESNALRGYRRPTSRGRGTLVDEIVPPPFYFLGLGQTHLNDFIKIRRLIFPHLQFTYALKNRSLRIG
jgi:hypothetical protein